MKGKYHTKILLAAAISLTLLTGVSGSHDSFEDEADPSIGSENAEVTMEVWCDFEGPFCKKFFEDTLPQIQDHYIGNEDLEIVFKDRPLETLHPWSKEAATVMECVHRQEDSIYIDTAESIYGNQDSINNQTVKEEIIGYAADNGANESQLRSCMNEHPVNEVSADIDEAESKNISATPTVIIGEQRIEGAQDYNEFEEVINSELGITEDQEEQSNSETDGSETSPEDLENRIENNSNSNVTQLKERLQEQEKEIEQIKEQQNTIVSILDDIMNVLGL